MPAAVIPFVNALQSGDEELAGASPQAINVVIDGSGAVRRRPGISALFMNLAVGSEPVTALGGATAMHVTEDGSLYVAVPQGTAAAFPLKVYRATGTAIALLGSAAATARGTMTETEMLLVIATGSTPAKVVLAAPTALSELQGSPPSASHIIHNSIRLLGNDTTIDRTKIRYSEQAIGTTTYAGHEDWVVGFGTAGYFTAEASPDPIVAIGENINEVWAFGTRTTQIFTPDDSRVYAPAMTMEVGCSAPYSVVKREDAFCWLDHARRFVRSTGRGTEVLSGGLQQVLQNLARVDDCYGYRVLLGPVDGLVWTFPSVGRTFFRQEGAGWSEWYAAHPITGGLQPWLVTAHHFDRTTGRNYVSVQAGQGVTPGSMGGVAVLRMGQATDLVGDGDTPLKIAASVTTGFVNRQSDSRKLCKRVRLTFRPSVDTGVRVHARGQLQWRDSIGPWEPPLPIIADGAQPVCEINSLGTYHRRQWRYTFSDDVQDLVFVGAEETYEVLE